MSDRLTQLQKLHEADPSDPFCLYGIALEYGKQEQFATAIEWLDKTLAADANYCYAYFQKAKMLSAQGEDDAAREVLQLGMQRAQECGDDHARSEMAELMANI